MCRTHVNKLNIIFQQSCKFLHSHLCEGDSHSSVMELEGEVLGLLALRGDCTNPMPRAECSGVRFGLLSVLRAGEEGICLDSEAEVDDAGDLGLWPRFDAGESNASSFQPPRPRSLDLRTGLAAMPTEVRVGSPEANIFAVCNASLTAALTCGILSRRQLSNACKWSETLVNRMRFRIHNPTNICQLIPQGGMATFSGKSNQTAN
jgi:hypothetical protein